MSAAVSANLGPPIGRSLYARHFWAATAPLDRLENQKSVGK